MFSSNIISAPKTIRFKNFTGDWCKLKLFITLSGGFYELTYTATYSSLRDNAKTAHPMYELSIQQDDESLLEGVIVAANPITEHMIDCLLGEEKEMSEKYNLKLRPYGAYCGEIMRALSELEI
jgi:hypothetical protein